MISLGNLIKTDIFL